MAVAEATPASRAPWDDPARLLRETLARFDDAELNAIAAAKRAWERLLADPALRAGPAEALGVHAPLHVIASGGPATVDPGRWPEVALFGAWRDALARYRDAQRRLPDAPGADPRFTAWRRREMVRAASELGGRDAQLTHPAIAYELSSGCSVGCWFCGVSAGSFRGHAPYGTHGSLWRDILDVMSSLLGPAAGTGVCFWGTDPFDNPDYDRFIAAHKVLTGTLPSTTTAIPLRDQAMTDALLRRCRTDGPVLNRFSVLSGRAMAEVLATWTARELLLVDLIPQMSGSLLPKARAGRVLTRAARTATVDPAATTIACVSGFIVNLPERRLRLVSPCSASDAWPLGFRTYADVKFDGAAGLRAAIERIMDDVMATELPLDCPIRFRPDLRLTDSPGAIRLQNGVSAHDVAGYPFLPELADRLVRAEQPLRDVIGAVTAGGAPFLDVLHVVQGLYDAALLEPADFSRTSSSRSTPAWS